MTDNTPFNADDELRNFIHNWVVGEYEPRIGGNIINTDKLMQRILADRKKHELQARIDELGSLIPDGNICIYGSEIDVRIAELSQTLKELEAEL